VGLDEKVVGIYCPQVKFLSKELPYIRLLAKAIHIVFEVIHKTF
jgi:hypothetical protein